MKWFGKKKENDVQPPAPSPPSITFKMVPSSRGEKLEIVADWAEGADLESYAVMLVYLQQGKLLDMVANAIIDKVNQSKLRDNSVVVEQIFMESFGKGRRSDPTKPIVCPTRATHLLLKPFQH